MHLHIFSLTLVLAPDCEPVQPVSAAGDGSDGDIGDIEDGDDDTASIDRVIIVSEGSPDDDSMFGDAYGTSGENRW